MEALKHGGIAQHATVNIKWVDSELLNNSNVEEVLGDMDGILVPGGFGDRGIEGKITAIETRLKKRWTVLWRSQNRWSFHSENDSPLHPLLLSRCRAGCWRKPLISGLFSLITTKTTEK